MFSFYSSKHYLTDFTISPRINEDQVKRGKAGNQQLRNFFFNILNPHSYLLQLLTTPWWRCNAIFQSVTRLRFTSRTSINSIQIWKVDYDVGILRYEIWWQPLCTYTYILLQQWKIFYGNPSLKIKMSGGTHCFGATLSILCL